MCKVSTFSRYTEANAFTPLSDRLIDYMEPRRFQSITTLKTGNNIRRPKDNENWQEQMWHRTASAARWTKPSDAKVLYGGISTFDEVQTPPKGAFCNHGGTATNLVMSNHGRSVHRFHRARRGDTEGLSSCLSDKERYVGRVLWPMSGVDGILVVENRYPCEDVLGITPLWPRNLLNGRSESTRFDHPKGWSCEWRSPGGLGWTGTPVAAHGSIRSGEQSWSGMEGRELPHHSVPV